MSYIRIYGGKPLSGCLKMQGSKNAALPILAAAILHPGKTILHNCPRIRDVNYMLEILKSFQAKIDWEGDTLVIDCTHLKFSAVPSVYGHQMRSSIILFGAMLGRFGRAILPQPGGCIIGERPINMHLDVLHALGAEIGERDGFLYGVCPLLKGNDFCFLKSSVGATQQAILAAVKAEGVTRLYGCAREPEVVHLARHLNSRGADIRGIGSRDLEIHGVEQLCDVQDQIPPDRIVAGTYLCACAATRGQIQLEDAPVEEMQSFLQVYHKIGGQYEVKSGKLVADSRRVGLPLPFVRTEVYPGFPTDLQSPLMAVLALSKGTSHIRETIFEGRYRIVSELRKMGAQIEVSGQDAWIHGVDALRGGRLQAKELRGGAALVVAGLAAQGETLVEDCGYIERGYEHICEDLQALGGNICREADNDIGG